jgi:hypothetical protein
MVDDKGNRANCNQCMNANLAIYDPAHRTVPLFLNRAGQSFDARNMSVQAKVLRAFISPTFCNYLHVHITGSYDDLYITYNCLGGFLYFFLVFFFFSFG